MNQPPPDTRSTKVQPALVATAVVIVLALAGIGIYTWWSLGAVEIDANGYMAMVLGVLGTMGLGVGLMALVFFSHRYGYDEKAGGSTGKTREDS
jgi:hypothetical protein